MVEILFWIWPQPRLRKERFMTTKSPYYNTNFFSFFLFTTVSYWDFPVYIFCRSKSHIVVAKWFQMDGVATRWEKFVFDLILHTIILILLKFYAPFTCFYCSKPTTPLKLWLTGVDVYLLVEWKRMVCDCNLPFKIFNTPYSSFYSYRGLQGIWSWNDGRNSVCNDEWIWIRTERPNLENSWQNCKLRKTLKSLQSSIPPATCILIVGFS